MSEDDNNKVGEGLEEGKSLPEGKEIVEQNFPEIDEATKGVRTDVAEQFRALEDFEERNWVEDGDANSQVMKGLYDRMSMLELAEDESSYAGDIAGVDEVPEALKGNETEGDVDTKVAGSMALGKFFNEAAKPYNLFHLDRSLSESELRERIDILDEFYRVYKEASADERDYLEELMNRMFGVPQITPEASGYLAHLDVLDSTLKSEGAENENLLFAKHENKSLMFEEEGGAAQVLKISKARHNIDFTSMLKLMKNMHILMLWFNKDLDTPSGQKVQVKFVADDMLIYKDEDTNYKRMIRQPYAKGTPVKGLSADVKKSPEFQDAWQTFLKHVEDMREAHGAVLDMTDSSATWKENKWRHFRPWRIPIAKRTIPRGNVAHTENVFVHREEDGSWLFSVIDPDVFDTVPGEDKFDPVEHARTGKNLTAKVFGLLNKGRDATLGWQDKYMGEERKVDS